jgi:hypothetical protein
MDHTLIAIASHEIPAILLKASVFGGKIAQPSSTTNASSIIARIDIDNCGVMFIKLQHEVEIEKKRPIAIRLNYRNLCFSLASEDYSVEGQTLIGQIPTEARAIALRDTDRYVFPLDRKISAEIHRVEKRGGSFDANIVLVDFSRNGLGFILPDCEREDILTHDHLWVKSLNGIPLEKPIFGRIIYAYERKFKDTIDIKCGNALESSLPEETYMDLQRQCRLILRG